MINSIKFYGVYLIFWTSHDGVQKEALSATPTRIQVTYEAYYL